MVYKRRVKNHSNTIGFFTLRSSLFTLPLQLSPVQQLQVHLYGILNLVDADILVRRV